MVRTVLGEITADEMGNTSVHEHLVGALVKTPPECLDDEMEFVIEELHKAKAAGLDTIIEVSPSADPRQIYYIAERSPVNIVACTGFYCFWSEEEKEYSTEQFLEHMLNEAENGIDGTDILPGVMQHDTPYVTIEDRREAIAYGIEYHQPGDVIILAGKGHETYQIIGKEKFDLDERLIVAECLAKRGGR